MSNSLARVRYGDVQYRLISDLTSDYAYVCRINPDGRSVCEWQSRPDFLGYDLREIDVCGGWLRAVHPDDRPLANDVVARLRGNQESVTDLRVLTYDGEVRWLRLYARPEWDVSARRVVTVHGAVQDITISKRGEADKAALLEIAHDLDGTLDVGELLSRVQRRTSAVLPCDCVATFLWDEEAGAFCVRAQHGVDPELIAELRDLRIPKGTFGGQTEKGRPVLINDVTTQTWLSTDLCTRFEIRALIAVPLRVRGRHFGTLVAYNTRLPHRFTPRDVELCNAIAGQVAVAVEAAELYRAQQEQAVVSGALARVGQELIASLDGQTDLDAFCRLVADVLRCEICHTWLWSDKEDAYVPAGDFGDTREQWELLRLLRLPRAAETWLTGAQDEDVVQVAPADHPSAAVRAATLDLSVVMQIRLRRGERIFGIVSAGFRHRRTPFSSVQIRIARGIAQMASMALSHARLVDELERVNRLKSDFVATMSHELRTPLNALMGYTDLLACGEFGAINTEQSEVLRRMDHAARELLDLINATLDLSRIESQQMPIDVQSVDLNDLLREIDAEARSNYERRGLGFSWHVAPELRTIQTDRIKLKVIVKNLLANALKFTERGSVSVAAQPHGNGVEVSVRDTGIGIAPDILPIIFEPFRQGESAATRRYGGVGLGLYVVRRLLDLLGGSVNVETTPGRGSTFRVWVPAQT
ncbi:MAG: GAF domain-containing protein [Deltaproteobacteria bacterium]|nr:GAF domain-containing protein [Deltaproteobacteria bacterium]